MLDCLRPRPAPFKFTVMSTWYAYDRSSKISDPDKRRRYIDSLALPFAAQRWAVEHLPLRPLALFLRLLVSRFRPMRMETFDSLDPHMASLYSISRHYCGDEIHFPVALFTTRTSVNRLNDMSLGWAVAESWLPTSSGPWITHDFV
jgi:hypothetical protein